jgi:hypothetical protein
VITSFTQIWILGESQNTAVHYFVLTKIRSSYNRVIKRISTRTHMGSNAILYCVLYTLLWHVFALCSNYHKSDRYNRKMHIVDLMHELMQSQIERLKFAESMQKSRTYKSYKYSICICRKRTSCIHFCTPLYVLLEFAL